MNNFKFGNRSRDRRDSPGRNFGGRDSRRPSMHDAVCDECGRNCQVPFRPSGDKPIYCSDCFEKKGGRESNRPSWRGSGRRNFDESDRSTSQLVEKIEILNTKLETIIKLLSSKGRTEKNKKSKPKKRAKTKIYSSVKSKASDK